MVVRVVIYIMENSRMDKSVGEDSSFHMTLLLNLNLAILYLSHSNTMAIGMKTKCMDLAPYCYLLNNRKFNVSSKENGRKVSSNLIKQ